MKVIVGLGNPGKKFNFTPHNLGFMVIDALRSEIGNGKFVLKKGFFSQISEGMVEGEKIILVKPQTFMNASGLAVEAILKKTKLEEKNLWVIHDDLDLPLGKIKISLSKGAGGHKGVQSIIESIGSKNFVRFRLGIAFPHKKIISRKDFVLKKFKKEDKKKIKKLIAMAKEIILFALKNGLQKTMEKYNQ